MNPLSVRPPAASLHRPREADDSYETPPGLAEAIVGHLGVPTTARVLEPHAGTGAIVRALATRAVEVHAVDLGWHVGDLLGSGALWAEQGNTLSLGGEYDLVVANPPFDGFQRHIRHLIGLLRASGRLAVILPITAFRRRELLPFWRERPPAEVLVLSPEPRFVARDGRLRHVGATVLTTWLSGTRQTRTTLGVLGWQAPLRNAGWKEVGPPHAVPAAMARTLVRLAGIEPRQRVLVLEGGSELAHAVAATGAVAVVHPPGEIPTRPTIDVVLGAPSRRGFATAVERGFESLRPDGHVALLTAADVLTSSANHCLWRTSPANSVTVLAGANAGRKDRGWGCYALIGWCRGAVGPTSFRAVDAATLE